ncbi:hypothetical protein yc1106_05610 [Curvularia clavata]|uniref:Uncharacterized protein n=1 Tax=Curvularia clavata TaxID=95742 RepID=A0A9Q9DUD6_CURCL|nr:hypothetical protein yc1106_05610 [Curvularia clavata]
MSAPTTDAVPIPREPSTSEALSLFQTIEETFPSKSLGPDKWYIVLLAALVSGGQPNFSPLLYQHLIQRSEYQTPDERQALLRRLRETLMKLVIIVGVCKPLEAIFDIAAVVRDEDKDLSATR